MHGKPGIRKALFVERNIKLFLHDAVHVRKGLERHHHGVHIARFRLGVDEVEGNVHHLAVWQLQPGFPCQQLPCLFGQLCLLGVQVAHIVGQRGRDFDALSQPLRRKVQVVGQGKWQVGVQRTVQLDLSPLRDLGAGQHQRAGQIGCHAKIFWVHVVKRSLDAGKIRQLVRHFGEPNPPAQHHQLLAVSVQCQGGIVVDLSDDFHTVLLPASNFRTKRKTPNAATYTTPLVLEREFDASSASEE